MALNSQVWRQQRYSLRASKICKPRWISNPASSIPSKLPSQWTTVQQHPSIYNRHWILLTNHLKNNQSWKFVLSKSLPISQSKFLDFTNGGRSHLVQHTVWFGTTEIFISLCTKQKHMDYGALSGSRCKLQWLATKHYEKDLSAHVSEPTIAYPDQPSQGFFFKDQAQLFNYSP